MEHRLIRSWVVMVLVASLALTGCAQLRANAESMIADATYIIVRIIGAVTLVLSVVSLLVSLGINVLKGIFVFSEWQLTYVLTPYTMSFVGIIIGLFLAFFPGAVVNAYLEVAKAIRSALGG